MIVRLRVPSGDEAIESGRHPWLKRGETYVVLAIETRAEAFPPRHGHVSLMIHLPDDDAATDWGWWSAELFEVVSGKTPSSWRARLDGDRLTLMPAAWLRDLHWTDMDTSELDSRPEDVQAAAMRRAWSDYVAERDQILDEARGEVADGLPDLIM